MQMRQVSGWGLLLAWQVAACGADVASDDAACSSGRCAGLPSAGLGGIGLATNNAGAAVGGTGVSVLPPVGVGTAGVPNRVGAGVSGSAGARASAPGSSASGGANPGSAGRVALGGAAAPGSSAGRAGSVVASAGTSGAVAAAGTGTAGASATAGNFEAERVACVDYINMYRATLMLAPLKRATPEQEACSDKGAKKDGDSGVAHGSAGDCYSVKLFAQNTCPGYPVGAAGVTKSLTGCLDQMWDEGEPPQGSEACKDDLQGCYPKYGHWINMTDPAYKSVACSFYKMTDGKYWMNQNFGN